MLAYRPLPFALSVLERRAPKVPDVNSARRSSRANPGYPGNAGPLRPGSVIRSHVLGRAPDGPLASAGEESELRLGRRNAEYSARLAGWA